MPELPPFDNLDQPPRLIDSAMVRIAINLALYLVVMFIVNTIFLIEPIDGTNSVGIARAMAGFPAALIPFGIVLAFIPTTLITIAVWPLGRVLGLAFGPVSAILLLVPALYFDSFDQFVYKAAIQLGYAAIMLRPRRQLNTWPIQAPT